MVGQPLADRSAARVIVARQDEIHVEERRLTADLLPWGCGAGGFGAGGYGRGGAGRDNDGAPRGAMRQGELQMANHAVTGGRDG